MESIIRRLHCHATRLPFTLRLFPESHSRV